MVLISVLCPLCHSDHVIKGGKTKAGQQRYKCQNTACPRYSFQLDLLYKGSAPAGRVSDMHFPPRHAMRMPSSEREPHSRHFHALSPLL
jgi:InsA N-terminal domain